MRPIETTRPTETAKDVERGFFRYSRARAPCLQAGDGKRGRGRRVVAFVRARFCVPRRGGGEGGAAKLSLPSGERSSTRAGSPNYEGTSSECRRPNRVATSKLSGAALVPLPAQVEEGSQRFKFGNAPDARTKWADGDLSHRRNGGGGGTSSGRRLYCILRPSCLKLAFPLSAPALWAATFGKASSSSSADSSLCGRSAPGSHRSYLLSAYPSSFQENGESYSSASTPSSHSSASPR